jgi:hypothetical protein
MKWFCSRPRRPFVLRQFIKGKGRDELAPTHGRRCLSRYAEREREGGREGGRERETEREREREREREQRIDREKFGETELLIDTACRQHHRCFELLISARVAVGSIRVHMYVGCLKLAKC